MLILRNIFLLFCLILLSMFLSCDVASPGLPSDFNDGWRFILAELDESAAFPDYDDSSWEKIRLPHDWAISRPFDPKGDGSTGKLPWRGVGWYRKTFSLPKTYSDKKIIIEFDGVYMNSTVWINGHKLGIHHYGYTSFHFDLTPHLKFGKKNVLAVRVDNSKRPNTR